MNCPKAGVALIIRKNDKVLLGKRKGNHAPNTWGFPGGHLEMWESFKNAALRELMNQNYLLLQMLYFITKKKHYITIFMVSDWISGEPYLAEPDKSYGWYWFRWSELVNGSITPLIIGTQNLIKEQINPFEF